MSKAVRDRLRRRTKPGARPEPGAEPGAESEGVLIPHGVRVATEWSWRFLLITAAVAVLIYGIVALRSIVVPVAVAVLLTALVVPVTDRLTRLGLPSALAAASTLIGVVLVVLSLFALVGQQIVSGFPELSQQVGRGIEQIHRWLVKGPLGVTEEQISSALQTAQEWFGENREELTQGALRAGTTVGEVIAGLFIALFAALFFLYQGDRIWAWLVRLFPLAAREDADRAGRAAWVSLTAFVRATVLVAFVDAVGITAVALILKVPLAVPIGVLVFLMSFIPIVGAVLSGAVAVLVALVAQGPLIAVVMLAGVLLVQQLESHVLQPLLMGRFVRFHPLAVLLAIATGSFLAGILGALFAVPIAAVINAVFSTLVGGKRAADVAK